MRASLLAALLCLAMHPAAAEVCRYSGRTEDGTRLDVTATVTIAGPLTTTGIALAVNASHWWWDVQYLHEEIATVRAGELQSVAVNTRTIIDGRPRRQQWDVFTRTPAGLVATRVQGRSIEDLRAHHAAFATHWDAANFARPWLAAYPAAQPDRRPDLDLPAGNLPLGLRPPLALAFYWSRFLQPSGQVVAVFLPGFKHDARVQVTLARATPTQTGHTWRTALIHPAISARSSAAVQVTPAGDLYTLAFDIYAPLGNASGLLSRVRCES